MKSTILILFFIPILLIGQTKKTQQRLDEIKNEWEIDNKGNATYTYIIENLDGDKDKLYNDVKSYFSYNFLSADDVIETDDKEAGLLTGKGVLTNFHLGNFVANTWSFDLLNVYRVDVKDGRVRIMITPMLYIVDETTLNGLNENDFRTSVSEQYPLNEKGSNKNIYAKAFISMHEAVQNELKRMEESLRNGNTGKELNDW